MKIAAPKTPTEALPAEKKRLKKACEEFESIFVSQMLKEMRPKEDDPIFGESHAKKMYEEMLDEERAKALTKNASPLGIGDALYKKLIDRLDWAEKEEKPPKKA